MSSENTNTTDRSSPDYLAQLLKDKKQFQNLPAVFTHAERLLDRGKRISSLNFVSLCTIVIFLVEYQNFIEVYLEII